MATKTLRVALEVWSADFDQTAQTCVAAEQLGFDAFYYGESPTGLNLDCWTALSALASETQRIRLGPVIANILYDYRSLLLLAKQAATLAIVSHGRLDFRTGTGAAHRFGAAWWEPYGIRYPQYEQRLQHLTTALGLLAPLWAGQSVTIENGHRVSLGLSVPVIPVTVAATGRRAVKLACSTAHRWESGFRTPTEVEAEIRAANKPASVAYSLEIDGFIGTSEQAAQSVVSQVVEAREPSGEDLGPVLERALLGTPEQVAEQMIQYHIAGVEQLVVALHDPHDTDSLHALATARSIAAEMANTDSGAQVDDRHARLE